MNVVVPDPEARERLVSYLRERGYLVVVEHQRDTVQVQPLNSISERHDRSVLKRDLREWRADNRGVIVELR
jgi:hypothetical protein